MYLVLGAGGFVGSAVCRHLERIGAPYKPVGRGTYTAAVGTHADVVVNCTGNARRFWANEHPMLDFQATVETTMGALRDLRTSLFVQMSSVDVYPDTADPARNAEDAEIVPALLSPYGFHKWLAETLVRRYAPSWLILRLGGLVGEGLKKNPIYDALHSIPLRLSPDSELGFIDTADVARSVTLLVDRGIRNEVYNVCGTGTVRMSDLSGLLGRPVAYVAEGELERQAYRVSNAKLRAEIDIPSSRDAVLSFAKALADVSS